MRPRLLVPVLACCAMPAVAHAQGRLALDHIPDVSLYEAIWPLSYRSDGTPQLVGSFGLGFGRLGDTPGSVGMVAGAAGIDTGTILAAARSELLGWAATRDELAIERGRHRGLVQVKTGEELGLVLSLSGALEHGDAPGLAPVHLGGGRRTTGDSLGEVMWLLDPDDESFAFTARGEAGRTAWHGGRRADRRALALAFGLSPNDDELPHGMVDLVRGRVEHTRIAAPVAFAAGTGLLDTSEVRRVDVGIGVHDLTLNIDHELAAVIVTDFGWSWLEADSATGHLADSLFRLELGAGTRWRDRRRGRLVQLGLGLGRDPSHTPDGERLVSDWRLELSGHVETRRLLFGAAGGIGWLSQLAGAPGPGDRLLRYGSQLEAFVKVGAGLELGGYHVASYEPAPGDPWASARRWSSEAGLVVRIRTDATARAAR